MDASIGHAKRRKVKHKRLLQPGRVRRPPAHARGASRAHANPLLPALTMRANPAHPPRFQDATPCTIVVAGTLLTFDPSTTC